LSRYCVGFILKESLYLKDVYENFRVKLFLHFAWNLKKLSLNDPPVLQRIVLGLCIRATFDWSRSHCPWLNISRSIIINSSNIVLICQIEHRPSPGASEHNVGTLHSFLFILEWLSLCCNVQGRDLRFIYF